MFDYNPVVDCFYGFLSVSMLFNFAQISQVARSVAIQHFNRRYRNYLVRFIYDRRNIFVYDPITESSRYREIEIRDSTMFLRFIRIFRSSIVKLELFLPAQPYDDPREYLRYFNLGVVISEYMIDYCSSLVKLNIRNFSHLPINRNIVSVRYLTMSNVRSHFIQNISAYRHVPSLPYFPNVEIVDLYGYESIPVEVVVMSRSIQELKLNVTEMDEQFLRVTLQTHTQLTSLSIRLSSDFDIDFVFRCIQTNMQSLNHLSLVADYTNFTHVVENGIEIPNLTSIAFVGDFECIRNFNFRFLRVVSFSRKVFDDMDDNDITTTLQRFHNARNISCFLDEDAIYSGHLSSPRTIARNLFQNLEFLTKLKINNILFQPSHR